MFLKRTVALIALILIAGQPCFAQSGEAAEDDGEATPDRQRKQYLVELIVFEYLGPDSSAGERFDSLVVSDYFPGGSFDIQEYSRLNEMVSYTDMRYLSNALQRLSSDEQYRILERLAWTQPLLSRDEAIDINLGRESAGTVQTLDAATSQLSGNGVSGSVSVYGGFHLFVELDIKARLKRGRGVGRDNEPDGQSGDNGFTPILGADSRQSQQAGSQFNTYHLVERRRIKLEERHYFDHPYLGAIVSVWRH